MTPSINEINKLKRAPAVEGVLPIILARWSPRAFADRDVSPADLTKVFEAARWAPSSYNEQPWRFIVGTRDSEAYKKIGDSLMPFNQLWALKAPVLILGVAKTRFTHNDTPNLCAAHDLGAASGFITLQADALGLVTHQMGGFDRDKARAAFGIPATFEMGSVMALGYQGEVESLANDQFKRGEVAPRTRKPLSEIVLSRWETPAKLA